jgi:hypothetical protein
MSTLPREAHEPFAVRRAGIIDHVAGQVAALETRKADMLRVVGPWDEPWRRRIEETIAALPEIESGELDRLYLQRFLLTLWLDWPLAEIAVAERMLEELEGEFLPEKHEQPCSDCDFDCRRLRVLLLPVAKFLRDDLEEARDDARRRAGL